MLICIFYEFSAAYSTNCRYFVYLVLLIFRVGGKDKPTRFLSFVEAVHGFRHLLTQEDLDRAMSLCTSLKGHLKSKFLVLSDDRILPPYQPKSGKRSHPDNSLDSVPGKRTHQDPGVSGAQASAASATSATPAASFSSVVQTHLIPGVSVIQASAASATSAPPPTSFPLVVPQGPTVFPPLMIQGQASARPVSFASAVMSVPPPLITQPAVAEPGGSEVARANAPAASYKVRSRQRGKGPAPAKTMTGTTNSASRLTPSRAAKGKKDAPASTGTVTSPHEQYESCDSNDEGSVMEDQA